MSARAKKTPAVIVGAVAEEVGGDQALASHLLLTAHLVALEAVGDLPQGLRQAARAADLFKEHERERLARTS